MVGFPPRSVPLQYLTLGLQHGVTPDSPFSSSLAALSPPANLWEPSSPLQMASPCIADGSARQNRSIPTRRMPAGHEASRPSVLPVGSRSSDGPAEPHWHSAGCSSLRWCCSRRNLHLWSLQEVSLSRYTGKLRLAENLFCRGFAPSFAIWLPRFPLKHRAAPLDYKAQNPQQALCWVWFSSPLPRCLAPLQTHSHCETAACVCSVSVSLPDHPKSGSKMCPEQLWS